MGKTTIEVKDSTWMMLNRRKKPGQSFDDVIRKLANNEKQQKET